MTPTQLDAMVQMSARVTLLLQLMRFTMRELAVAQGKTPDDIMRLGEGFQRFFEASLSPEAQIQISADADAFFAQLAKDVARG